MLKYYLQFTNVLSLQFVPSSNLYEQDFLQLWSKAGQFSIALSKGAKTTTWIWNLHSDAHDFFIQPISLARRKVFSSSLAHLSLLFFWLGGMHFHGAYFTNYCAWSKDPKHCLPSAVTTLPLAGDILNSDVGGYFQGYSITSGFFQLWRSMGMVSTIHLKYASTASLIATIICIGGSYFHMHISFDIKTGGRVAYGGLTNHHLSLLLGLGCMSWSAHEIHISVPANRLLDSGVDPAVIPYPQDFSFMTGSLSSVPYCMACLHHFYLALVLIAGGIIGYCAQHLCYRSTQMHGTKNDSLHGQLSINLLLLSSGSIVFAHYAYAQPIYPYLASDYPTVLSLFCHHINIGGLLIVGAGAHASICLIMSGDPTMFPYASHRHLILGHLIYVALALGMHSFGLYIHNDTLQALYRPEDMFSDGGIQLKPVFGILCAHFGRVSFDIEVLDGKISRLTPELGTADFMVHHIHAFTIHVTLLILLKGILYARSSRLVSDKLELGWRYPCDGPGRGGTCQISPYDQLYNAVFCT